MRAIANKITTKSNASKASTNSFSAKTTIKPTRPKRATTRHKTTRRSTTTTTTPKSPVKCRYRTLRGMNMELNWFPTIDRGQEFIDYGQNVTGLCLQRATCENDATWTVKVEECSDFNVVCENQLTFQGEFPACCIEC
ncbi:uncharacterized protein LOC128859284 [Anastrepha ludens]|uniref:uncharacterized protein LOC128859284 n=1 Tax=Anastrepha ludens TaxID=28586 RepID=UPI0023B17D77|nr:uncharacterized protein LOC128859284 [Anastrepha ludens]XP_053952130.1 uncharacterized protein LOC128859284 [Anastrepha ludens]